MSAAGRFEDLGAGIVGLRTPRSSIAIDPGDGGRLVSLRVHGHEILGSTAPVPGRPADIFHGSFVMAPFVGRTAHGRFSFDGVDHAVPVNFGAHAIHGFVFDRPWRVEDDLLVIDLDERWPFGGRVSQRFDLGPDHLTVTVTVANDRRAMPALAGFHPWFRRRLADGTEADLDFRPGTRYVCDDSGIPVGTAPGGGDRPWDDSFTGVARPPAIRWGDRLELRVETTGTHWIVCETMPDAFCVEPLSGPVNGLATGRYTRVEPGDPLRLSMTLRWK
ncbi:aldose 1-epimerase [Sphaerisporangium krabiense]|uniref:Aldose 1-epimerase n=1 Tax=Sphaerisporangium krabiense TaxID=763782 RepID=A0A7W9DPD9_9ACTN|nr:aldose 1-epimerase [Sphaerisporangium krabiense]MBB5625240.1 aldose 1-epimerase [Sphaerisporangium krabiense]GII64251.1 aldose 1-epimerase [Sphaerisporangium krabiense]